MSRPLYRGSSGGGGGPARLGGGRDYVDHSSVSKESSNENGFGSSPELPSPAGATLRTRAGLNMVLLKLGLALTLFAALSGSLYWTISISASSRVKIYRGYRRLQEKLVTDLRDVGDLSRGMAKSKEMEFCSQEYENYVPCYSYNVLDGVNGTVDLEGGEGGGNLGEYTRNCARDAAASANRCLVLPPLSYRIPLRWPSGKDFIWKENVKIAGHEFSSGSLTKRMMVEEEQLSFKSDSLMVDGVEDYTHQIAEMIGLSDASGFNQAGIRTVLDVGCGFGSFGAHLFSKNLLTMGIANYEVSGSQVQLTLERGLPAIIGSFASMQLPFPYLSFDMIHCAKCGIEWELKDGIFLAEVDRLLRPGGYFVWTSRTNTHRSLRIAENQKKLSAISDFAENLCWEMSSQQDETIVWRKTDKKKCYSTRKSGPGICGKSKDIESPYYRALIPCIGGTRSHRWIPIESRKPWPSRAILNTSELDFSDLPQDDFPDDTLRWKSVIPNYWSLLSPLIFSDHPKRPGDEDPSPPFNMLRNVMDMNAKSGGFNAALLDAGKDAWVMNVVPTMSPNSLPLIFDRGFIGIQHDWCEAFPTYPRTYDMIHAEGLLSLENHQNRRCSMFDLFLEMDRILRPEGWVIFRDASALIESARYIATQLKWDARLIELDVQSDDRLLVCLKPFFKSQQQ